MHVQENNGNYLVVLEKGEPLMASLTQFAADKELKGAIFSGIGALEDVELGAYDTKTLEYIRKTFSKVAYELISLNGNLSLKDGEPFVHLHAALGDHDFNVFGGHLFEATVAVTAEISVRPLGFMPERELHKEIGLALICKFHN
jgi:predicted DNA-binding protein with PD1-like motif